MAHEEDFGQWAYDPEPDAPIDDDWETAMQDCGLTTDEDGTEICTLAGTDHCDWHCPYSAGFYARMSGNQNAGQPDRGERG